MQPLRARAGPTVAPGPGVRALLLVLVVVLLIAPACTPLPVYKVQRTARVPHPAAPLDSAAPLEGPVELSLGASNALDTRTPRLADPTASVEVPTTQARGELRIRVGRYGQIALIHERSIESTFQPLDRTQAPVETGTAWSAGAAFRYAIHVDEYPELTVGLGVELLDWTIPYVEYRSCVQNCDGLPLQQVNRGTDTLASAAFSITPTYRRGPLTVFAGLYAAPHPTIVRKGDEYSPVDYNSELDSGRYNYVLHAGAQYRFGAGISLLAQIQTDVTRAPASYAPSFGFALSATIPDGLVKLPRDPAPLPRTPMSPPPVQLDDRPW